MHIRGGERVLALLGYLLVLFVIPLNVKKDSMFVQFHARQGAVLFGLWFVITFILFLVLAFVRVNIVETIVFGIIFLATGLYLLFALLGMFKVLLGERYRMPVVADVALLLGL